MELSDALTKQQIAVSVGSTYVRLTVNERDYYFDRLTGRLTGRADALADLLVGSGLQLKDKHLLHPHPIVRHQSDVVRRVFPCNPWIVAVAVGHQLAAYVPAANVNPEPLAKDAVTPDRPGLRTSIPAFVKSRGDWLGKGIVASKMSLGL